MSKEYGAALFELALENGCTGEYVAALETVEAVFAENPAYTELLAAPNIPLSERLAALRQAFEGVISAPVLDFLLLLCEHGQITTLPESIAEYRALYDEWSAVSTARVVSAVALTGEQIANLQQKLTKLCGHTVEMHCETDPALLGGLLVEIDGKVIDGSLRHRLREIKDVISL